MSATEWGEIVGGLYDKLYGIQREEGDFSELATSYVAFLQRAQKGIHAAFPYLPTEIFTNDTLLAKFRDLLDDGGEVEVLCHQSSLERSQESIEALRAVGAVLYISEESFNPFTIVDEKSVVFHHLAGFSKTRWEQVVVKNTRRAGADLISDFIHYRETSRNVL
jgi:hypothetical protein